MRLTSTTGPKSQGKPYLITYGAYMKLRRVRWVPNCVTRVYLCPQRPPAAWTRWLSRAKSQAPNTAGSRFVPLGQATPVGPSGTYKFSARSTSEVEVDQ
jgi:hypothetical protein